MSVRGQDDSRRMVRQHGRMSARRSLALALVGAVVLTLAPSDPAAGATTSRLGQRYEIVATLDVAAGRLDAVLELTLTNESAFGIDHVNLGVVSRALGFLTLTEAVTVDGVEATTEWTTGINLRVPVALAPGAEAVIRVPFHLDVGRPPDAFTARLSRENGVLSFGQWFPIVGPEHDVYGLGDPQISYTADAIRLELTTTTDLPRDAVACPGLEAAPKTAGRVWTCESTDVRDLSFVVNPRFRLTTRTVDDHEIRVYTETVSGTATADLAANGLIGMEETFGDYPWPDLVLAEVGSGGGFSMEYPRMVHLTRDKVADPYVVYHEVAHQWFYGQLGNHQQREPWLDEAFADFSARYLMGIGENACSTRPVDSTVFAWEAEATSGGDWTSCDGYFHAVFYQGTEFITAVRSAMGDGPFFDAMRDWVARHRHGFVRGRGLLRHWVGASDADLQPIYDRYLDGAAVERPFRLVRRPGPPLGPAPE
jgi:hypothetical protein